MKKKLINPELLIHDTVDFIKKIHLNLSMHIVSGSDGIELNYLCKHLKINNYFKTISGSPTPKTILVNNLIKSGDILAESTCLIGDAVNDFEAANTNQIDFFGYNNLALKEIGKGYLFNFKTNNTSN